MKPLLFVAIAFLQIPALAAKFKPKASALAPNPTIVCKELPNTCGLVSRMKPHRCEQQWFTEPEVKNADSCAVVIKHDPKLADYSACLGLYRDYDQHADFQFSRQFGSTVISRGSCTPIDQLASCSPISAINQGEFCRCPETSRFPVAGCYPNGSGTICMSSSIAESQCN